MEDDPQQGEGGQMGLLSLCKEGVGGEGAGEGSVGESNSIVLEADPCKGGLAEGEGQGP